MEDDNTRAVVEIRRPKHETTDPKDEDISGDEEILEEDDNGDGEEPSGTTLHSGSTHQSGGVSTDTLDHDYHPSISLDPKQSSDELATTTKG